MGFLANWKIYAIFAGVLVLFYFMYTAKIAENAILTQQNKTLTEVTKNQENFILLKDTLLQEQEKLLIKNREDIADIQKKIDEVDKTVENVEGFSDDAAPYLKEYFKELDKK